LQVHAWINVNLVAGANELPAARDHVIYRHPEWLMVPRALGEDFQSVDPRTPQYLGRLARHVRSQTDLERLYPSPASDGAIECAAVVHDAAAAVARRLQKRRGWLDAGLLHVVCPMACTTASTMFASQIHGVREVAGRHPIWAGIGAYRLSSDQMTENVQRARR